MVRHHWLMAIVTAARMQRVRSTGSSRSLQRGSHLFAPHLETSAPERLDLADQTDVESGEDQQRQDKEEHHVADVKDHVADVAVDDVVQRAVTQCRMYRYQPRAVVRSVQVTFYARLAELGRVVEHGQAQYGLGLAL